MALDGFFIHAYTHDLHQRLEGLKIEKIYQLGSDLVIHFRGRTTFKLRLSADSANPRLLITEEKIESPESPPMFCMLMRKHLMGGVVKAVLQDDLERIVTLVFSARNDFGDRVDKQLIIEIMGKHSNIILTGEEGRIIDSIKRVNPFMSPRPIGPGQTYSPPPTTKVNSLNLTLELFTQKISEATGPVQKAIYTVFSGISPVLATSMLYMAEIPNKTPVETLNPEQLSQIFKSFNGHVETLLKSPKPYCYWKDGGVSDFSAIPLMQLRGAGVEETIFDNYDSLLELVFKKSNDSNRLVQKSSHLVKLLNLTQDRLLSKITNLENDLLEANKLDGLRLYGELLTANLHLITRGMSEVTVFNYYDNQDVTIPLDVTKGPNENAQRYYKRYNKAKTTLDEALHFQVNAEADYDYLEGVKTLLLQSELPEDVDAIKEELIETGFMKSTAKRREKKSKKAPPYRYTSSEGVAILVGRNNLQNDELTLKKSFREHIWLHTKDVPGSHVIIQAEFPDIENITIIEAAQIAAYHSKARYSSQVAVDFTEVKFVKKAKGAKPGLVIYEDFKTIYVTPEEEKILEQRQKETKNV